jgi:gluconate 2-dehydrogenase gamma chain
MKENFSRRDFLSRGSAAISAVWLSTHWAGIAAAAEHARQASKSSAPAKLQFFSPEQAAEIDAITARIIPSGETPGAHEAGVVYFIDRALTTFAIDEQKTYRDGLPALQSRVRELFPNVEKFSSATPDQQDQILQSFAAEQVSQGGPGFIARSGASPFFETLRVHTVVGFLIDPDSTSGGNRDGVGWKVIGRDPDHMFHSPFGYYDKDYAGWQPNPPDAEKTKA